MDFILGKKHLRFFGSDHSREEPHINFLREKLNEFEPNLILIEGGYENADYNSENEALENGIEMGFVNFYAKSKVIMLKGNDPPSRENTIFVESFYGKKMTFLYFILRNSLSKVHLSNKKNFKYEMNKLIQNFKSYSNWENFEYSLENFKVIFFNILKEHYQETKDYLNMFNPNLNINQLNLITRKLNIHRDYFMLNKIIEEFKNHDKIFIIKGSHHLKKMKEILGELFK